MKRGLAACFLALALPAASQPVSIGIVLTGGGSFGAFETGALQAFFEQWSATHCPGSACDPPIAVIAGCSTGALIAPFAALGPGGVNEVAAIYRNTKRGDVLSSKAADFLPLALFANWSTSVFGAGPLRKTLQQRLPDARLDQIAKEWPSRRLVVLGTDFQSGMPVVFSSDQIPGGRARFRDGILASAGSPLATPPVYLQNGPKRPPSPILDGGVHAVAPFQAFFDAAARPPAIVLTHVIVFSPYPRFPAADPDGAHQIQQPFPARPNFSQIGARMDTLISESSISKEIALASAAIELRNRGVGTEAVLRQTGLHIPTPPASLIVYEPSQRLGWDNLRFDKAEMGRMADLGRQAAPRVLIGELPR
jgi:predicted acylesterase/phospholipase RssA